MKRRILCVFIACALLSFPVHAEIIRWVDFGVPYESLKYAMNVDIETFEQEKHISWIDILSVAACHTGGKDDRNPGFRHHFQQRQVGKVAACHLEAVGRKELQ